MSSFNSNRIFSAHTSDVHDILLENRLEFRKEVFLKKRYAVCFTSTLIEDHGKQRGRLITILPHSFHMSFNITSPSSKTFCSVIGGDFRRLWDFDVYLKKCHAWFGYAVIPIPCFAWTESLSRLRLKLLCSAACTVFDSVKLVRFQLLIVWSDIDDDFRLLWDIWCLSDQTWRFVYAVIPTPCYCE